ncbi:MAG: hypothetical protein K6G81_05315 [Lachnospiraceae bacterium]|nr:hypothetical protein [Lachnospiraceae bacterium]
MAGSKRAPDVLTALLTGFSRQRCGIEPVPEMENYVRHEDRNFEEDVYKCEFFVNIFEF